MMLVVNVTSLFFALAVSKEKHKLHHSYIQIHSNTGVNLRIQLVYQPLLANYWASFGRCFLFSII